MTQAVDNLISTMRPGLPGVEVDSTVFSRPSFIDTALGNLAKTGIVAALLLLLAFFIFFRDWRFVLIGIIAVPLSLLAGLFVLDQRGATANVMLLAGLIIALGIVIDDVATDVQNIARHLAQPRSQGGEASTATVIIEAASEVRGPIMFGTLIVLVAAFPFLFLEGVNGAILQPLVQSYGWRWLRRWWWRSPSRRRSASCCYGAVGKSPRGPSREVARARLSEGARIFRWPLLV